MTAFDDDELARALARVPIGEYAPIERLRGRARQLHLRRRLAGGGLALAAVLLVAVPSALALGGGDVPTPAPPAESPNPAPTGGPDLGCPETYSERYDTAEPYLTTSARDTSGSDGVPNEVRLLWPVGTGAVPNAVFATDRTELNSAVESLYTGCPPPMDQSVLVVDVDGDVVTRAVEIRRTGGRHVVDSTDARILDVDATQVRINDTGVPEVEHLTAEWERDGISWTVQGNPLSENELSGLVRTMRVVDGRIDLSGWLIAGEADHVIESPGVGSEPASSSYEVQAGALALSVRSGGDATPWLGAGPGSLVTDVAGELALLSEMPLGAGWMVTWHPSPGVIATLSADVDADDLVGLAESIAPVAADDPRLLDAWATTGAP